MENVPKFSVNECFSGSFGSAYFAVPYVGSSQEDGSCALCCVLVTPPVKLVSRLLRLCADGSEVDSLCNLSFSFS